jgi:hypothetical protein
MHTPSIIKRLTLSPLIIVPRPTDSTNTMQRDSGIFVGPGIDHAIDHAIESTSNAAIERNDPAINDPYDFVINDYGDDEMDDVSIHHSLLLIPGFINPPA